MMMTLNRHQLRHKLLHCALLIVVVTLAAVGVAGPQITGETKKSNNSTLKIWANATTHVLEGGYISFWEFKNATVAASFSGGLKNNTKDGISTVTLVTIPNLKGCAPLQRHLMGGAASGVIGIVSAFISLCLGVHGLRPSIHSSSNHRPHRKQKGKHSRGFSFFTLFFSTFFRRFRDSRVLALIDAVCIILAIVFLLAAWAICLTVYHKSWCDLIPTRPADTSDEQYQIAYGCVLIIVAWIVLLIAAFLQFMAACLPSFCTSNKSGTISSSSDVNSDEETIEQVQIEIHAPKSPQKNKKKRKIKTEPFSDGHASSRSPGEENQTHQRVIQNPAAVPEPQEIKERSSNSKPKTNEMTVISTDGEAPRPTPSATRTPISQTITTHEIEMKSSNVDSSPSQQRNKNDDKAVSDISVVKNALAATSTPSTVTLTSESTQKMQRTPTPTPVTVTAVATTTTTTATTKITTSTAPQTTTETPAHVIVSATKETVTSELAPANKVTEETATLEESPATRMKTDESQFVALPTPSLHGENERRRESNDSSLHADDSGSASAATPGDAVPTTNDAPINDFAIHGNQSSNADCKGEGVDGDFAQTPTSAPLSTPPEATEVETTSVVSATPASGVSPSDQSIVLPGGGSHAVLRAKEEEDEYIDPLTEDSDEYLDTSDDESDDGGDGEDAMGATSRAEDLFSMTRLRRRREEMAETEVITDDDEPDSDDENNPEKDVELNLDGTIKKRTRVIARYDHAPHYEIDPTILSEMDMETLRPLAEAVEADPNDEALATALETALVGLMTRKHEAYGALLKNAKGLGMRVEGTDRHIGSTDLLTTNEEFKGHAEALRELSRKPRRNAKEMRERVTAMRAIIRQHEKKRKLASPPPPSTAKSRVFDGPNTKPLFDYLRRKYYTWAYKERERVQKQIEEREKHSYLRKGTHDYQKEVAATKEDRQRAQELTAARRMAREITARVSILVRKGIPEDLLALLSTEQEGFIRRQFHSNVGQSNSFCGEKRMDRRGFLRYHAEVLPPNDRMSHKDVLEVFDLVAEGGSLSEEEFVKVYIIFGMQQAARGDPKFNLQLLKMKKEWEKSRNGGGSINRQRRPSAAIGASAGGNSPSASRNAAKKRSNVGYGPGGDSASNSGVFSAPRNRTSPTPEK